MRLLVGKELSSDTLKALYDHGVRWDRIIDLSLSPSRVYSEEFSIVWMYGDAACAKFGFSKAEFFVTHTIDDPPCDHSTGFVRLPNVLVRYVGISAEIEKLINELLERFP